jgi:HK97 family phage portal protein
MMDGLRTAATRLALRAARALSPEMRATYTGGVRPTDPRILEIFGGAATSAGVSVTEENAMRLITVASCVGVLSDAVSQAPCKVVRIEGRSTFDQPGHPLWSLLMRRPHPMITAISAIQCVEAHRQYRGNGYMWADYGDEPGVHPVALMPLDAASTSVQQIQTTNGTSWVYRTTVAGRTYTLLPGEVVHIKGHTVDGISGVSPIRQFLGETIGLGIAARERQAKTYANGGVSGVINFDGRFSSKEARDDFRRSWQEAYGSLAATGRTAVLEKGMSFSPIGLTSSDAQLMEDRKNTAREIMGFYRVPPHMVGDMERATFSNIEELDLFFVKHTLARLVRSWELELEAKLLTPDEVASGLRIRFDLDDLLRGDIATRYEAYAKGIAAGFLNRNEVREREGLPVSDDRLDSFLRPLNMEPEGTAQADTPNATRQIAHDDVPQIESERRADLDVMAPAVTHALGFAFRLERKGLESCSTADDALVWWSRNAGKMARDIGPVFLSLALARRLEGADEVARAAVARYLDDRRVAFVGAAATQTDIEQRAASPGELAAYMEAMQ